MKILDVNGNTLHIENIDILDGTPLLDIKPYLSVFDEHPSISAGWLDRVDQVLGDIRFENRLRGD